MRFTGLGQERERLIEIGVEQANADLVRYDRRRVDAGNTQRR
jgi:hypothetical protein